MEAVYIKATEGTIFKDSYLDTNYSSIHYPELKNILGNWFYDIK